MLKTSCSLTESVFQQLQQVKDPEMPNVSLLELGMIEQVEVAGEVALIDLLPTYVGCPAIPLMEKEITEKVLEVPGISQVKITFLSTPLWTSNRISDQAREKLKEYGIAVPPKGEEPSATWKVHCPYCASEHTMMQNIFGPTACRSIMYCSTCKNPFEAIKPV